MIALLDQQRVTRRPESTPRDRSSHGLSSYGVERFSSAVVLRPRKQERPVTVRGRSERLDSLIRGQSVRLPPRVVRPVRELRRVERVLQRPQARVRVLRPSAGHLLLASVVQEGREYLRENWRILSAVALGSIAVLLCVAAFAGLPLARRAPPIMLTADERIDTVLLEGKLPEPAVSPETLAPSVVKILQEREHIVRSGETLSEIAASFGLRLGTIINYNNITDVRSVPAGKRLKIPNGDGLLYVVRRGDSLGAVAARFDVSVNAIRDWNDLQSDVIRSAQRLFIPGASMSEDDINRVLGKLFIYPTRGSSPPPSATA